MNMTGEIFARVLINETERKEIEKAISIMDDVANAYSKTGLESVRFLIDDLNDGISALKGVLEELYY
jgi:uncharacterized protein YjgD (DUF1641 family)